MGSQSIVCYFGDADEDLDVSPLKNHDICRGRQCSLAERR